MSRTARIVCLLCLLAASAGGCQTYQRQPLELHSYAEAWADRSLDVEPIQAYAGQLAGEPGDGSAFNAADGLSVSEAEAVALHFNPNLRLIRAEAGVPLAGAEEAGWWPDPQFEAEVLRFANRGRKTRARFDGPSLDGVNTGIIGLSGLSADGLEATRPGYRRVEGDFIDDPWIVGASLSLTIPVSGRLAVEKDVKWAEYSAAWRSILVAEWDLLTRVREGWLLWSTAQERVQVTREYLERLAAIADIAQQLADAGEMKPTEARVLHIELARRRTSLTALEADAEARRLALFALLGVAPDAPVTLQPDVFICSVAQESHGRQALLLKNHPRIKAVEAGYEAAEQQLRLEVREQYPDLQIGPSFSFEEGFTRLGMGFGFPLPLWNRNRQAIAEAFAEREAARIRAQAEVEAVLSELARVESQLTFASQQRGHLLQEVAPLVDKQVADSRTLLDLGEVDVLLLRDALTSSLDTKLELLDATLAEARAANELDQMLQPRWITPSQADTKKEE